METELNIIYNLLSLIGYRIYFGLLKDEPIIP